LVSHPRAALRFALGFLVCAPSVLRGTIHSARIHYYPRLKSGPVQLTDFHLRVMSVSVIDQLHDLFWLIFSVHEYPLYGQPAALVKDGDVIDGFPVAVVDLEGCPGRR